MTILANQAIVAGTNTSGLVTPAAAGLLVPVVVLTINQAIATANGSTLDLEFVAADSERVLVRWGRAVRDQFRTGQTWTLPLGEAFVTAGRLRLMASPSWQQITVSAALEYHVEAVPTPQPQPQSGAGKRNGWLEFHANPDLPSGFDVY